MRIVCPFAIGVLDPYIVIAAFRRRSTALLLTVSILNGHNAAGRRGDDSVWLGSFDREKVDPSLGAMAREIVKYLHGDAIVIRKTVSPLALRAVCRQLVSHRSATEPAAENNDVRPLDHDGLFARHEDRYYRTGAKASLFRTQPHERTGRPGAREGAYVTAALADVRS
jgi:hypothetical protein